MTPGTHPPSFPLFEKKNCIHDYFAGFFPFKRDLKEKNENVHELKGGGKQPLSELKTSQSVKLIVKDGVIETERKMNAKIISF